MKTGLNLMQFATQLTAEQEAKRDFIADTRQIVVSEQGEEGDAEPKGLKLTLPTGDGISRESFGLTRGAHKQIASRLKVPQPFYDRMLEKHPDLLAHTVQGLFQREPERRMVRTMHGKARAFLSDRYRIMDNLDLAEAILPVLKEAPDLQIVSTQVTENRMFLKALFPRTALEVKKGDVVQSGIVISNSETGDGSLRVQPLVFRLICLNGLIAEDFGQKKYHVGRAAGGDEEGAYEFFRDETLAADDKALWLKVQDTVRAALQADSFGIIVGRMRDATGVPLVGNLEKVVELTAKRFGHTESDQTGILRHLIDGHDLSLYGLMNAITRHAQDVESYEHSTDLERDGGRLIELPRTEWDRLALAA